MPHTHTAENVLVHRQGENRQRGLRKVFERVNEIDWLSGQLVWLLLAVKGGYVVD